MSPTVFNECLRYIFCVIFNYTTEDWRHHINYKEEYWIGALKETVERENIKQYQ